MPLCEWRIVLTVQQLSLFHHHHGSKETMAKLCKWRSFFLYFMLFIYCCAHIQCDPKGFCCCHFKPFANGWNREVVAIGVHNRQRCNCTAVVPVGYISTIPLSFLHSQLILCRAFALTCMPKIFSSLSLTPRSWNLHCQEEKQWNEHGIEITGNGKCCNGYDQHTTNIQDNDSPCMLATWRNRKDMKAMKSETIRFCYVFICIGWCAVCSVYVLRLNWFSFTLFYRDYNLLQSTSCLF